MKFEPKLYHLSNGVTVILDPMDLETAKVKIVFKTGGRDEKPNEHGITHFCEHMFCKGTKRFPSQRVSDEYLDYNAGYKEAYTSMEEIAFHGRILGENVNVLVDVLCDQIQNSLFLDDKIEIERKVITDELRRALDDQQKQFIRFREKTLFGIDVPNGSLILGSFENIAGFSRNQMLDFISKRFSAKNCIVCVSGCIQDEESLLKCLEKNLSFLPEMEVSENKELIYTPTIAHDKKSENKDVKLRIYFPRLYDSKLENRYKRFAVGRLFNFIREELYEIIRRENGLAYGFSCGHVGNENLVLDSYSTKTAPEHVKQVVALVAKNLYRLYSTPVVTSEILDRFYKSGRLGEASFLESASGRCDRLIGFYKSYDKLYDYYEVIRLLGLITPEEVFDYSRGMFDGEMSILTQGPDFDGDLKQIWMDNFK